MTAIPLMHQDLRIFARPLAEGRDIAIEIEGKRRLDLDAPFFRVLGIDISTPVDFAKIGLFSTDVMIDYGNAADAQNHRLRPPRV
jgi:hypothetical protein